MAMDEAHLLGNDPAACLALSVGVKSHQFYASPVDASWMVAVNTSCTQGSCGLLVSR